jgi:hypothetical protein
LRSVSSGFSAASADLAASRAIITPAAQSAAPNRDLARLVIVVYAPGTTWIRNRVKIAPHAGSEARPCWKTTSNVGLGSAAR